MAKTRLTCDNCGFGEELDKKQLKARQAADGGLTCPACGAPLGLPAKGQEAAPKQAKKNKASNAPRPSRKNRRLGLEAMTGLDDVIDGEIVDSDILEDAAATQEPEPAPVTPAASAAAPADDSADDSANDSDSGRGLAGAAAGAAREKLRATLRHGRENPLFVAETVSSSFRKIADAAHCCFDNVAAASVRTGHYILIITAALAVIFGLLISLRSFSLSPLLTGVTLAALLVFAQYLALRAFDLLADYIPNNPTRLPGPALPEVLSAFAVLTAILGLLSGLSLTIIYYSPIWLGLSGLAVIIGFFGAAAFTECRARLAVSFEPDMPASEIIVELMATMLKGIVAVLPFVFGLGSAALALCMIWPTVSMLVFSLNPINTASFFVQESGLLFCAFAPISAYLFILLWAFILQVARTLLGLGAKK